MSLTGDNMSRDSLEPSSSRRATWYARRSKSNSEDLQMGVQSSAEEDISVTKPRSLPAPPTDSGSASGEARPKAVSSPSVPRFSFFNVAAFKGSIGSPVAVPKDDELIDLDISAALSAEILKDGESPTQAAFNNLHMNASGLLRRFQSAYQDKAIACQELKAERDSQQDEKMEMETRAALLKRQLEDMAHKASETEIVMQALMQELNQEKSLRIQEGTARESVVLSCGTSTISEDLGAEDDQRKTQHRQSAGTMRSEYAAFDTDDESIDEASVFSRSRTPPLTAYPVEAPGMQSGSNVATHVLRTNMLEPPRPSRQSQPQQQVSAFQKLMKGITGDSTHKEYAHGCPNCQGRDASVAWDTVNLLQDENRGLKERVCELETAVEGALDAVMGVNL